MALPKRKTSKARRGKRRAHSAIRLPSIDYCPQCHSMKRAHHVCLACGTYVGRQVVAAETRKKE